MSQREEIIVDIRGQVCPSSLLMTLRSINRHRDTLSRAQAILKIMTDSRDAIVTIPNAVLNMGFASNLEKMPDGHYQLSISRESND